MKPLFKLGLLISLLLSSCLSSVEGPVTGDDLLRAEVERLEKDPEAVGLELLAPAYEALGKLQEATRLWALQEVTTDAIFAPRQGA